MKKYEHHLQPFSHTLSMLLVAIVLQVLPPVGFAQPQYVQVGTLPLPSASDRVEVFDAASQQLFSFPTYNAGGYPTNGYVSAQSPSDTFSFTNLPGLFAVYWGRVVTDDTNIYSVGGYGDLAYNVQYVPIASISNSPVWQTTTTVPNLVYPIGRALHQSFIYKGNLYILGGYHGDGQPLDSDVEYAPILTNGALGSFVSTTSLPLGMASHSATVTPDGRVYVANGTNLFFARIATDGSIGSWITQPSVAGMNHNNDGNTGMALVDNMLVIVDYTNTFICELNSSGQFDSTMVTITNPAYLYRRSVYVNNGKVYVTATTGNIYRIDDLLIPDFLTNGMVACYPFNGNANDTSGNGNNGTVYGATPATDRFGVVNGSFAFNGTNQYISLPAASFLNSNKTVTISLWVEEGSSNQAGAFFGDWNESNGGIYLNDYLGSSFAIALLPNGQVTTSSQTLVGKWHQVVVVFDGTQSGSQQRLVSYIDGVSTTLFYNYPIPNTLGGGASAIIVGGRQIYGSPGNFFTGQIDDLRIYNRPLSSAEIAQLYAIECGPLVRLTPVDLINAVQPTFSNLTPGVNYQLQISSDLNTWYDEEPIITATSWNMAYPLYFDMDFWDQLFFRLHVSP